MHEIETGSGAYYHISVNVSNLIKLAQYRMGVLSPAPFLELFKSKISIYSVGTL